MLTAGSSTTADRLIRGLQFVLVGRSSYGVDILSTHLVFSMQPTTPIPDNPRQDRIQRWIQSLRSKPFIHTGHEGDR